MHERRRDVDVPVDNEGVDPLEVDASSSCSCTNRTRPVRSLSKATAIRPAETAPLIVHHLSDS